MCDFVLFCLVAVVSFYFLPAIYRRGVSPVWGLLPPDFTLFSYIFLFFGS